jgi:hypothetical protein
MSTPERAKLLRDIDRSSELRSEITSRMDDENYSLKGRWEELEKLDFSTSTSCKVRGRTTSAAFCAAHEVHLASVTGGTGA